ncbi:MAG TPA: hypothetical protein PLB89_06470 [Flavobacteriales bacterium]|nr:hypothetical protein [Flavobacteriales bacterium]
MSSISRNPWSALVLFAVALLPSVLLGQGRFTVNGRMKIEGSDLSGARAVVYKNGSKERSITSNLNKFSLDLDLNAEYVVSFEKEGYVAKKVSFNTKAPAEAIANGFTPFDFAVSLFKQYDDINIVVFNQPVGMIRYDDQTGDFDYDTDYTKSIQSQLQQVLAQVEIKQKEEAATAKAAEAAAAEEAKAKAKAEAELAKQEAAKAKADAEAQKQALAEAKAEEKRQAEAKKAEKPPVVVEKVVEKPEPKPKERPAPEPPLPVAQATPVRNTLSSKANIGEDGRRTIAPVVVEESPRVAPAKAVVKEEERPAEEDVVADVVRSEELLVEPSRVTAIVKVSNGDHTDEYRKVTHKFGGQYYFKNGATCTREVFEREASADQLAGATPRSKLD